MDKDEILDELFWELHNYRNGYCTLERFVVDVWNKAYYTGTEDYKRKVEEWD